MKFIPKTIVLIFVLVMASACSAAFETAGLNADDAAMLSSALSVNPVSNSYDFNYTVNLSLAAEGETMNVTTAGRGINDQETGNSLLSMAGEVSGVPDLGGASQPYDIEFRGIGENELYIRGFASLLDPTADANAWLFLDVETSSQMAMAGAPELQDSAIMSDGNLDVAAIYDTFNSDFFGSAANYVTATRLDDMGGQAHFQVDLAIGDWLGSDELQSGLETMIPKLAAGMVPDDEIQSNIAQMSMGLGMASMVFSDGTYQFDYFVDPASGQLTQVTMTVAMTIDPAMLGETGDPGNVDLVLDVIFNEFGADSTVTAPEESIDVMEMMMGG